MKVPLLQPNLPPVFVFFASIVVSHPAVPFVVVPPESRTVSAGTYLVLGVEANGTPPFGYQWRKNAGTLLSATNQSLTFFSAQTNDSGTYDVMIRNAYGAVTSAVARVRVNALAPGINNEPSDHYVCDLGTNSARFIASSSGWGQLYRQWYHNGSPIPGAITDQWTVSPVTAASAGNYVLIVRNDWGAATSRVARLLFNPAAPVITRQPLSALVPHGSSAQLWTTTFACTIPTFQWRHNGSNLPGPAQGGILWFNAFGPTNAGDYDVTVTAGGQSVTSVVASLELIEYAPRILWQPLSQTVNGGQSVALSIGVDAAPAAFYQWFHEGVPINGATNSQHSFVALSTNLGGDYFVVATNPLGAVTSQLARVTVLVLPPVFVLDPVSQGAVVGSDVLLSADTRGQPPGTLQWFHNGLLIPGATNNFLAFTSVTTNDSGVYTVVATNEAGADSRTATLTVMLPGPLDQWVWRRPLPQGNDLFAAAHGDPGWVVVGETGARWLSRDGANQWLDASRGLASHRALAWGNGRYVSLAYAYIPHTAQNLVHVSTNGLDWTERSDTALTNVWLDHLAFGNGRFVGISFTGSAAVSSNGLDWQLHSIPYGYVSLAFGNNLFMAANFQYVYTNGGNHPSIGLSSDGINWTNLWLTNEAATQVVHGNGRYVAVGQSGYGSLFSYTSSDGLTWVRHEIPGSNAPTALAFGAGRFAMAGQGPNNQGVLFSSVDGVAWEDHTASADNDLYDVAYGGGRFLAVGNYGTLQTSTNGRDWARVGGGSDTNFRSLIRGNGLFVAVGNEGLIATSLDSVVWNAAPAPTTNNLRGVAYGAGRFVAVGEADLIHGPTVVVSTNGQSWTLLTGLALPSLYNVIYDHGVFAAVGLGGTVALSSNGLDWTPHVYLTSERLNAAAWSPERFVAVGRNGAIVTTTNFAVWQAGVFTNSFTGFLQGVAYGDGVFVAAGQRSQVARSTNGVLWHRVVMPVMELGLPDVEDVIFAAGQFILVGEDGFVASSADGSVWTPHPTGCQNDLRDGLWSEGLVTAVGNNQTIIQSGFAGSPILRVRPSPQPGFAFSVDAEMGRAHRLQASTNLVHWQDLFTFTNHQTTTVFSNQYAPGFPQRFYRVLE